MHILILYGTSEGQTRKVAKFIADRLRSGGHDPLVIDALDHSSAPDITKFDALILAARVHAGLYQRQIVSFARDNRTVLNRIPNAFLSVSMSAAKLTFGDEERLKRYVNRFIERSGWTPQRILHVAGARFYTRHNAVARWILGVVDGNRFDTRRDHEWTDWSALQAFADDFAASLQQAATPVDLHQ